MKLKEVAVEYESGRIAKEDYIKEMHEIHHVLFEYSEYIRGTDIKSIEITDDCVVITTKERGVKMYADVNDMRIIPIEILNFKVYEKEEQDMIGRMLEDSATILDIGANIGWCTINIAMMKQRVTVHAFEPIPKTFRYLKKNIALNNVTNANVYNFGFSDKSETRVFYYYPEGSGNASMVNVSNRAEIEEIKCKVLRLDDFMRDQDFTVDFIKCDVEGAELFVFEGSRETLKTQKPIIVTEMLRKLTDRYDYHPNKIISLMSDFGYRCFTTDGQHLLPFFEMDENTMETNFFFLHEVKHESIIELYTAR